MGRRGRKRWLSVEDQCWKLILAEDQVTTRALRSGYASLAQTDGDLWASP